jgi:hypothetical protein
VQRLDDRYHAADHSVPKALPSFFVHERQSTNTRPWDRVPSRDRADDAETWVPDLERFRRGLRHQSVKYLRHHVDLYLVAWDEATAQDDNHAIVRARAEWNAVWDEIERRNAIPSEAAS